MPLRASRRAQAIPAAPQANDLRTFEGAAAYHRGAPPPGRVERSAQFVPASYDAAAHTVELVLSTGARVKRWGYFEEILIAPAAVNLDRVALGAVKVLNSHNARDVGDEFGRIVATRFAGGSLIGKMKFHATPHAIDAEGMVSRGELTSVSIGYEVALWRAVEIIIDPATEIEITVWRADEWTLLEVSFVSVPADPNAGVRTAAPSPGARAALSANRKDTVMEPVVALDAAPPPAPVATETRFSVQSALDFIDCARDYGLEAEARRMVNENIAPADARAAIMRAAGERQRAATLLPAGSGGHVTRDGGETSRAAIVNAIVAKASGRAVPDASREFAGMTIVEIARARTPSLHPRERDTSIILRAANTTSDFPLILEAAANKILLDRYAVANPSYRAIAKRRDLKDFKPTKLLRIGDFPSLEKYQEDGVIKEGTINEGRETALLGSYGKILRLSRQAIVNDDLNAFDEVFSGIGVTVALFENSTFYAAKGTVGPNLSDGKAVFHADHGNLAASGGALSVTTLGAARQAMRTQTNLDGKVLNVEAKTLFVGAAKETEAEQLTASITPRNPSDVNPFAGKLQVVAEGLIVGNAWEVYADPNLWPVFVYGYLDQSPGPRVLTQEPFDYDGMAWRVTLDFYAAATDYRGAYRNPGN